MGVTLYQMVYGTLPFWSTSGNHNELELTITHRELAFPPTSNSSVEVLFGQAKDCSDIGTSAHARGGRGIDQEHNRSTSGGKGRGSWTESDTSGSMEAHDPMVGYLKVNTLGEGG